LQTGQGASIGAAMTARRVLNMGPCRRHDPPRPAVQQLSWQLFCRPLAGGPDPKPRPCYARRLPCVLHP
jgi:hypothetical protein